MAVRTVTVFLAVLTMLMITINQPGAKTDDAFKIQEERNLHALATEASEGRMAILLVFGAANCQHCAWLEERVLKPMLRSGDYDDKLLIRKMSLDKNLKLLNFAGTVVTSKQISERYNAYLAPTVVLVDARGMPLSIPIIGIPSRDFYARKLDTAIAEALLRIRGKT